MFPHGLTSLENIIRRNQLYPVFAYTLTGESEGGHLESRLASGPNLGLLQNAGCDSNAELSQC